jgi:ubiquinone/menaquinone biosynthesis C-methylase UbiE
MKSVESFYHEEEDGWEKKRYVDYCNDKYNLLKDYVKGKVLDVGCGTGWFYKKHKGKNSIVNTDFINRDVPNFVKSSITNMPFKTSEFDTVLCLDVLEHLEDGVDMKALKELFRVGKRVILSTTFSSRISRFLIKPFRRLLGVHNSLFVGHYREYDEKSFTKFLDKKGKVVNSFSVKLPFFWDSTFWNSLMGFLKNKKHYYTKLFIVDKV